MANKYLLCWECKTCGHERWAPPAGAAIDIPCPGCKKEYPTWIGHKTGERSSCSLQYAAEPSGKPLLIYVGSSWKNADYLTLVHAELRSIGLQTWDFRENGFWWKDVPETDPYRFLTTDEAQRAYKFDKEGLDKADAGLFILPAGTATALEAGYMAGLGKPTVVWGAPREQRLDIMWLLTAAQLRLQDHSLQEVARSMLLIARDRGGCMP